MRADWKGGTGVGHFLRSTFFSSARTDFAGWYLVCIERLRRAPEGSPFRLGGHSRGGTDSKIRE